MHILMIAPEQIPVPPPVGGSVENSMYQISRNISGRHKVTIISRSRKGYPKKSVLGNVTIIRVKGGKTSSYLHNVLRTIRGHAYDIIQIDNRPRFVPLIRQAFPRTPISVFLHSTTFVSPPMTSYRKAASDLRRANLIVGNSQSLKNKLRSRFPSLKHKVKYVHLGADLKQFRPPGGARRPFARGSASYTVLFAGRLIPRKGIPVLMKAIKLVRKSIPARLVIAGGTSKASYKSSLKKTANQLHIPVSFLGYVPRRRMHRFYWSGDCFVCPSQKHEAFGLVNVEAMASGTPVIASRIGGIPEIVRHGRNGLLVSRLHSPEAFANAILRLARQRGLARRLANQARQDVLHKFSWKATASRLVNLYGRV